ncbi:LysR family transcriptional regulator, partial [Nocardia cyriacigeorgica]|uniref:LysR family transcriptional regulator n=1 Tax=Nocardia cyriacigeorgica TaxID=135487 RepID=UPI0024566326
MFDPVLLRSFVAVEQHGGFTAAARQLGLRQPTVSGHVAKLERELGRELFLRDTHSVTLTSDGAAMLGFAREILDAQSRAAQYFGGESVTGRIRFGVSEDLVAETLPEILREFRRDYPRVDLDMSVGLSEEVHARLRRNHLDLAFVKRRPGEQHGRLVFSDRLVWVGPAGARAPAPRGPITGGTVMAPSRTRAAALRTRDRAGLGHHLACYT